MSDTPILPSELFCQAWADHTIDKPIVILVGGYAGTGKSTLANRLAKHLSYAQIIPTGIFRSIAQTQTTAAKSPELFLSTYDLHTLYGPGKQDIVRAYKKQCAPVTDIITSVIAFLAVEKQHLIIEGNHVLPWQLYTHPGCHIIELYTYVKDSALHKQMLGGPTHNRTISPTQFKTGRAIHDILTTEALSNTKALFECNEMHQAEAYLQAEIAKIINVAV